MHLIKEQEDFLQSGDNKCIAEKRRSDEVWPQRLKMLRLTTFLVLATIICIVGDAALHSQHSQLLTTNPNEIIIVVNETGSVEYHYALNLTSTFTIKLNSSTGLTLYQDSMDFSPQKLDNKINVTGTFPTSRAYIDIKDCIGDNTVKPCSFNWKEVFVTVTVIRSRALSVLITVTGWIYFFAWSISFYPQILLNFQRKSVEGLNFDFLVLNIIGFFCYSVFNVMMYFDPVVEEIYIEQNPRAQIPVLLNDVVFALHALLACIITGMQCFFYERGNQRVSYTCMGWSTILVGFSIISLIVTVAGALDWLMFINLLSYVKMAVTLSKYFPQAILNFRRKSTVGWSIGNVLLDFTGGSMDIVQMILQGINTDDWTAFYGNPVKFGLGLISMVFDVLFITQHYCLYRHSENYELPNEELSTNDSIEQHA